MHLQHVCVCVHRAEIERVHHREKREREQRRERRQHQVQYRYRKYVCVRRSTRCSIDTESMYVLAQACLQHVCESMYV